MAGPRPLTPRILGLEEGDAHVIRNAGGRAADAIRSLAISQPLLQTREDVVVHHTDCGMLTFTDAQLKQKLRDALQVEADTAIAAGRSERPGSLRARPLPADGIQLVDSLGPRGTKQASLS
jgi:carbonic anhydrase